jgi:Tfp pilus assembly protein PilN
MKDINLISPDSDPQAQLRTVFGWLEIALIIVIGLMLAFTVWLQLERNTTVSQATLKKAERQKLNKDIEHASELEQKLATILDRKESVDELTASRQDYDKLMTDLAAATPPNVRFTGIAPTGQALGITGFAAQRSDITQFVDNLNKNPDFNEVQLAQANSQENAVLFSITFNFSTAKTTAAPSPTPTPAKAGL